MFVNKRNIIPKAIGTETQTNGKFLYETDTFIDVNIKLIPLTDAKLKIFFFHILVNLM